MSRLGRRVSGWRWLWCAVVVGLPVSVAMAECPVWPPAPMDVDVAVPAEQLAAERAAWSANQCAETMAARQALFNQLLRTCKAGIAVPPEVELDPEALSPEAATVVSAYQAQLRECATTAESEARAASF